MDVDGVTPLRYPSLPSPKPALCGGWVFSRQSAPPLHAKGSRAVAAGAPKAKSTFVKSANPVPIVPPCVSSPVAALPIELRRRNFGLLPSSS